jgi:hypothetical protein
MGVLYDVREERFAQLVVRGAKPAQAKVEAGYSPKRPLRGLLMEPRIAARIKELMERAANKAVLSRTDILERVAEDWDKARSLGQMSAALKAAEMVGKELHKMFVDRKEIGTAGEFDTKSEAELRDYISKELGLAPRQIEATIEPETEPEDDSPADPSENSIDGATLN